MAAIFGPATLAAGQAVVVDAGQGIRMTIIAGAGATATWSRVMGLDATAHGANQTTVAASTVSSVDLDWPYYRVSVAGGTCQLAVV